MESGASVGMFGILTTCLLTIIMASIHQGEACGLRSCNPSSFHPPISFIPEPSQHFYSGDLVSVVIVFLISPISPLEPFPIV